MAQRIEYNSKVKACRAPQTITITSLLFTIPSLMHPNSGSAIKNLPVMQEPQVRFLGQERSRGEGNGNPFQDACLENRMDRGVWWARVHGVAKSET